MCADVQRWVVADCPAVAPSRGFRGPLGFSFLDAGTEGSGQPGAGSVSRCMAAAAALRASLTSAYLPDADASDVVAVP